MHISKQASIITGAALVLSLGGGITAAVASIPDGSGVLHACYDPRSAKSHGAELKLVDTQLGGACSPRDIQLQFNQTGPQGAVGPAGATGPPGSQGPAGPGISYYVNVSGPFIVPPGGGSNAAQGCAGGDRAISGGTYSDNGATTRLVMNSSFPISDGRWQVDMTNLSDTITSSYTLYAVCEDGASIQPGNSGSPW